MKRTLWNTTLAFGFFLVYMSKIRKSIGEDEVVSDYKDRQYISFALPKKEIRLLDEEQGVK